MPPKPTAINRISVTDALLIKPDLKPREDCSMVNTGPVKTCQVCDHFHLRYFTSTNPTHYCESLLPYIYMKKHCQSNYDMPAKVTHILIFNVNMLKKKSVQLKKERTWFKEFGGKFPGSPVIWTPTSTAEGMGSIPGWRTKIPHAMRHG